uniref:hypothetical protein n=1 Tax=Polyozellus multiplex TaxID=281719 RepID=UPI001F129D7B|nr:hypothetical protein MN596_mgp07 [Polyozellus multiplex]UMI33316.1 hypothetical protein [Polyozellus multiplex]
METEAISKDDLDSGLVKIEGMNIGKMNEENFDSNIQSKFDSLKTKTSNPLTESLSNSPMLKKSLSETEEAEEAFSDNDSDNESDRIKSMKNKNNKRRRKNKKLLKKK